MRTPWGQSDHEEVIAEGIVFYSTPSHGGIKVSRKVLATMPVELQNLDGWYEEDCEILKVILAFPQLFPKNNIETTKEQYAFWFKKEN